MTDEERSPAQYAADIGAARERLAAFAAGCSAGQWRAAPLDGDPRPVGVIVDHVAHAYEYMGDWVRRILAGEDLAVDATVVDALNAEHAAAGGAAFALNSTSETQQSLSRNMRKGLQSAMTHHSPQWSRRGAWL